MKVRITATIDIGDDRSDLAWMIDGLPDHQRAAVDRTIVRAMRTALFRNLPSLEASNNIPIRSVVIGDPVWHGWDNDTIAEGMTHG